MIVERLLRGAGGIIALLALIDPTLTIAARQRPVVAVSTVDSASLGRPAAGGETLAGRVRQVGTQVAAGLAADFDVREGPAADAVAQVLVGDGSFPSTTPLIDGVPIFGVTVDDAPTPNVRVLRVVAPARLQLASRLRVEASIEGRGMQGRSSTIILRADDLEMARATHAWTTPVETARIALEAMPFRTGLARLSVTVEPLAMEVTSADNSAETAVAITNEKIRVLFVEARPSWMTRFARQALDGDERFDIKTLSRVSRGLTAVTPETPQALSLAALEPFAAVIVGAPDALTRPDVEALRDFARQRGGAVIFAPDQQPSGPYVDLLPARRFDEKEQDEPATVPLVGSDADRRGGDTDGRTIARSGTDRSSISRGGTGSSNTGSSDIDSRGADSHGSADAHRAALVASELALAHDLLPGAEVLGRVGDARTGAPVIISTPAGDGEVVFIGALDAWRHRGNGFDAVWRQLIATLGARAPAPISVTLDTPIVAPGGSTAVQVRVRKTLARPDGTMPPLFAHLSASANASAAGADVSTLRLWPGDQPDTWIGRLNAPTRPGVYAVSVGFDRGSPLGQATFLVASGSTAAAAVRAWDGLRTLVDAHGGLVVPSTDIPRLIAQVQQRVPASPRPEARHPFRSAWWMAPFAACLGGEWWLRRRRGQR